MSFFAPVLLVFLLAVPVGGRAAICGSTAAATACGGLGCAALLPNMAERPPPWRRHLPVALLLVGVALLLVGFARPTATMTVKRQEATVVLVLDVSGSMAARDSHADPARRARRRSRSGTSTSSRAATGCRCHLLRPRCRLGVADARSDRGPRGDREGERRPAGHRARRCGREGGRRRPLREGNAERQPSARRDRRALGRRPDRGSRHAAAGGRAGQAGGRSRCRRSRSARPTASSSSP